MALFLVGSSLASENRPQADFPTRAAFQLTRSGRIGLALTLAQFDVAGGLIMRLNLKPLEEARDKSLSTGYRVQICGQKDNILSTRGRVHRLGGRLKNLVR